MEKKTTVIYDPNGTIKNVTLSVGVLEGLQNLLLHYLSECKDHNEVIETYKKINEIAQGKKDWKLEGIQAHIYLLVALIQNLRLLAIEQGVAKTVEIDEAVHLKAKETAELFLKRDPNRQQELNSNLAELFELSKTFTEG